MSGDITASEAPIDRAPGEAEALVDLPPENWMEARRRYAVLSEYMKIRRPTGDDLRRAARRLDISDKTFSRLVTARRALQQGRRRPSSRRGLHSTVPPETDAIIRQVIDELGPTATDMAVHAEASRRAREAGHPAPSTNAIRSRRGRAKGPVDLRARLKVDCDEIIDCCPFSFDVIDAGRAPRPAIFTALISASTGKLLAWALHAGLPSPDQLIGMLRDARNHSAIEDRVLAPTWQAQRLLADDDEALAAAGYRLARVPSVRLRPGGAIVPTLGRAIGRAPFAPLRSPNHPGADVVIPLELARRVVERELDPPTAAVASSPSEGTTAAADPASSASVLAALRGQFENAIARATGADRNAAATAALEICDRVAPLVSAATQATFLLRSALQTALPPAPAEPRRQPADP